MHIAVCSRSKSPSNCVGIPKYIISIFTMETPSGMSSRKLTPFAIFYLERRGIVKDYLVNTNRGHCRPEDISREIAKLWSELDFESVKGYCLLSILYAESVEKHGHASTSGNINNNSSRTSHSCGNNSHGVGGHVDTRRRIKPNRKKDSRLPKPPISAFMWFSRHHRAMIRSENPDLSFSETGRMIGTRWRKATVSERRPFDDLAAEDKMRYARELNEYKEWLALTPERKERATVAAPEDVETERCTGSAASRAGTSASTLAVGAATSMATAVRAPLDEAYQAAFVGATDVGYDGDNQAVAAGPSDGTLSMAETVVLGEPRSLPASGAVSAFAPPTLPRKRTAVETATTREASWSASPILSSHEQEASSQEDTTVAHLSCAKRRRMDEASPVADAPDMSMTPKPVDAMRGVETTVGCTSHRSQHAPPREGST